LLLTESGAYRDLDWSRVYSLIARPLVLDARDALEPEMMKALDFDYHSFARPDVTARATLASSSHS